MFDRETFQLMPLGAKTTLPLNLDYAGTLLYLDVNQVNEANLEFTKKNYIAILSKSPADAESSFIRGSYLFTYHAALYDVYNGEVYYVNVYYAHNTSPKYRVGIKRNIG